MSPLLSLAVLGAILAQVVRPQAVLTQDPATGLYTITYTDESRTRRSVQFQGNDKVAPEISLAVTDAGPFLYRYQMGNGASAKQALFAVSVACEPGSTTASGFRHIDLWDSSRAGRPGPPVQYCGFMLSMPKQGIIGVAPGTRFGAVLGLQSGWLPGIREAEADGMNEMPLFPGFRDETPTAITNLYETTQSPLKFKTVSPKYPPAVLSDPTKGVSAMIDELTQACSLGWASPDGICNSLRVKLDHAQAAASAGDRKATAQHLETYVSELRAQGGKHVAEMFANAMIFDAEFMLRSLR